MSKGKRPSFFTGGRAKIKVDNITLAFVTDLSYSIRVNHAKPIVLGMYETTGPEPLSYSVSGSFTVIRYVADSTPNDGRHDNSMTDRGNGIGYWRKGTGTLDAIKEDLNFKNPSGRAFESFNPKKLDKAATFDIEIYENTPDIGVLGVAKLRGCRISGADFRIDKRGVAVQSFTFEATYADEDSHLADFSGRGQQFQ